MANKGVPRIRRTGFLFSKNNDRKEYDYGTIRKNNRNC